jgi:hypothetical protein
MKHRPKDPLLIEIKKNLNLILEITKGKKRMNMETNPTKSGHIKLKKKSKITSRKKFWRK